MNPMELRQRCHTFFSGEKPTTAAEDFAAMARWCEANDIAHDAYGEGALVQDFEKKIAELLGFEKAVFCITGTMVQSVALRLACEAAGSQVVALHPTAHVLLHERGNHQLLDHFKSLHVGDPFRTWTTSDLEAWPDRIGAALYELPMREIGGQLPGWAELEALKAHCRQRSIHLHMDGARLWEASAGYKRSLKEIAQGFDSVYVSFYKGIGAHAGAMLLGRADFIAKADMWMKRMGGNVYRRSPYVVSAAMRFDERLAKMPAYLDRTERLYDVLRDFPHLQVNPARPHVNMLHVYFPVGRGRLTEIRNELAAEYGIWLFGGAKHAALPDQSAIEWYVGEALSTLSDARVREILALVSTRLSVHQPSRPSSAGSA
ncbi:threonine aldolase [Polyangium fumosum]|uniref:Threonine aldolase n=2 Tax=Polyangium fumosum TaxID=889272 RepID=A0A4V5PLH9_9BACT|nr:threonine aldolase [Polyangium fumosum]